MVRDMPTPVDQELYNKVKKEADKKFLAPTSIYKSSWIVAEYKKRGGVYSEPKEKNQGLLRWFREKWVNLTKPIKDKKGNIVGYEECGRKEATSKGTYPLCRPLKRITRDTPKTVSELTTASIKKAEIEKQKIKQKGHVLFDKNKK
jgi:hypothetical protein